MYSQYGLLDVKTCLSIKNLSQQLMTSFIFSRKRTCGQTLFCQTSHWAEVLLPAKGCNHSHTWLVWPKPITASLLGSSVWQTANQLGPLQEPWSWAARHTQHFIPNTFLQAYPSVGDFACFVNISTCIWMKTAGYILKYTGFFYGAL